MKPTRKRKKDITTTLTQHLYTYTHINIKKNRNCCGKQQYIYAAATTVNVVQIVFVVVTIVRYQHLLPRVEVSF